MPVAEIDELTTGAHKLPPGGEGRSGARAPVAAMLEASAPGDVYAPVVGFSIDRGGTVSARFHDGRHRFHVLRDAGAREINVCVSRSWAAFLSDNGIGRLA